MDFFKKLLYGFIKVEAECGHKTKLYDKITVTDTKGESTKVGVSISTMKPSCCHVCFEKMVIRCAWCGGYILPGDPITLYSPNEKFEIPDYAVKYKNDKLIGCLRMGCACSGGDRAGFWIMPGEVQRVLSPIEEVFLTGKEVIVMDIGDIRQAKLLNKDL